jgi:hypothetical protein
MSAPAETIVHGTAQTYLGISDEPASSPTIKVAELARKYDRNSVQTENTNGTVVYEVQNKPKTVLSFTGQLNASTGLAAAAPGSAVATVANFAATARTDDPSVGIFILENIEDSTKNMERAAHTKFDIRHQPHIA